MNYGLKFLSWREPSGKGSWASALPDSDFGGSLVWGPLHRKLAISRKGALSSVLTCWVSFPQHSHAFIPSPCVQDEQHWPPPTRRWVSKSSFEVCWRYLRSWPFSLPVPLPRGRRDNLQRRKFLVSSCVYSFTEVERNMKGRGTSVLFLWPYKWAVSCLPRRLGHFIVPSAMYDASPQSYTDVITLFFFYNFSIWWM